MDITVNGSRIETKAITRCHGSFDSIDLDIKERTDQPPNRLTFLIDHTDPRALISLKNEVLWAVESCLRKQAERRLRERNRRLSAKRKVIKDLDLGLIQAYAEVRISQHALRDLLDSASNAVLFLKLDGTITGVNTKAKELLGYSRDELLEMDLYQLIPQSFSERTEEMFKKLRIGFSDSFETEILTNDKEILKLELNASVIEQKKRKVALIFFRQKGKVVDYGDRYCRNPDCPDYRKYGQGNIVFNDWIGKNKNIARLRCNTCRTKFSSNKGTVFEQSRSSREKGICIYKCLVHGNSIEATADICEVNPKTVSRLVEIAGEHDLEQFTAHWSED